MTSSRALLSALVIFTLLVGTGCSDDSTLSANQTLQAIVRARWTASMLNQAREVITPFGGLPITFTAEDIDDALRETYGNCVSIEGDAQHKKISISDACTDQNLRCSGHYTLDPAATLQDQGTSTWLSIKDIALQCGKAKIEGEVSLRPLPPNDEPSTTPSYDREMRIRGFSVRESENTDDGKTTSIAASQFHGDFYLRDGTAQTHDDTTFPITIVDGNGMLYDNGLDKNWAINSRDLGLEDRNSSPRSGTLQLRSQPRETWAFDTHWAALTENATQVRIQSGKNIWIGCISHLDDEACNDLGD